MSIAVMNWVWQHSPTSGNQRLVLLALADACSRDDGTGCWPAVATVARKANISPRSVRRVMADLVAAGHLIVHRGIGPRGTNGYSLVLHKPVYNEVEPVYDSVETVDNSFDRGQDVTPDELSGLTPATARGDAGVRGGVTQVSPNPPKNHHEPPPPTRARAIVAPTPSQASGGGGKSKREIPEPVQRFVAALGTAWPLSATQVRRLVPIVAAALADGWTPAALAEHVGANTTGVRNPYAVLSSRLTDLPDPVSTALRAGPADQTLAEALAVGGCPHGAAHPGRCALCRHGRAPAAW
ncbi:helix-turn-helix domain-containing protein [Streptosporangium jomthongense]|uniref:Helix-turn-helix domain-containing protein n=1 Tax=Streptosporangium jomthongense TaxID=1193683 RepID=A0ABV8F5A4_9ACTN